MGEPIKKIITPVRLEYTITPGRAATPFLRGLEQGRLMAQRCPKCRKVYIPPRGSCPTCAVPTEEQVQIADKGTVTTYCIVNLPFYGQALEIPYVCASILLDGADIPFFFLVQETPVEQIRMGMRVEAVWAAESERKPTLESIKYFRAIDEPDAPYESYKEHL
jgi:uncharacterized OB-fold protein